MGIGERSWTDRNENYADGYTKFIEGTTATAINRQTGIAPAIVYSLSFVGNNAGTTGDVVLVDGSATADSGDTRRFKIRLASGAFFSGHYEFPRGITFETGLIVSAATVTGELTLTFKQRYSAGQ